MTNACCRYANVLYRKSVDACVCMEEVEIAEDGEGA